MKKNEDKPVVIKLDRKKIKQSAKGRVKRNYIACIAVCFIMVFIAGEYGSTTQNMSSYDNSHVADLKYDAEDKEEIIEDMVKNELTAEQVSDKWQIDNPDAVKKWLDAYKKYGVDGLNSKEVTFFGSSNTLLIWKHWQTLFLLAEMQRKRHRPILMTGSIILQPLLRFILTVQQALIPISFHCLRR